MSDKLRGGTTIGGHTALHMGNINALMARLVGGFASADHTHTEYAAKTHTHTEYAASDHSHTGYAASSHSHDANYAAKNHSHMGTYASLAHTHSAYVKKGSYPRILPLVLFESASGVGAGNINLEKYDLRSFDFIEVVVANDDGTNRGSSFMPTYGLRRDSNWKNIRFTSGGIYWIADYVWTGSNGLITDPNDSLYGTRVAKISGSNYLQTKNENSRILSVIGYYLKV